MRTWYVVIWYGGRRKHVEDMGKCMDLAISIMMRMRRKGYGAYVKNF